MTDFTKNPEDMPVKLSRMSLLRSAALAVTSFVVMLLVLTGCTKEHVDLVKGQLPGGNVGSGPSSWYNLKINYTDEDGKPREAFMGPIGSNATTSFWDYMKVGGKSKFRLHPGENGFEYWEIDDGYWLSLRYDGWAYRSFERNRVGWKIINRKLYTDYDRWKGYALGAERRRILVPDAYYVGVNLSNGNEFTCELVPAE
jgi:hypothetical protein